MNTKVLSAVLKRNFVSYFASPTGYLFICVFVLLSAVTAFWPNEFFNTNLANLDQLNKWFPFIMLVFVPAITMSIWADERRQGTDELLLTVPASDSDIVLGKYLAAVAIYSVALLFSLVCNYSVLQTLGDPDLGLFLGTYVGYWLVGLAMLSIGMVASFLTSNVTVGYILGAIFNIPLVFAVFSETILGKEIARGIKQFSMSEQFGDFSRGILSISGFVYFGMIVAAMLYLSMILIGRRHWVRGRDWHILAGHYLVRVLALVVIAAGANLLFARHDARLDVTSERLSSLSSYTKNLLKGLDYKRPVQVEAYVSEDVPEGYVQAKVDLLNMLRELEAWGGGKVHVRVNLTDRFSEEAEQAEQRFGITPKRVVTFERGTLAEDHIFMGVAFTSGLQKVILPFIDRGISVEYELVRSLATVTEQKRKRVGVLQTDAPLYGRFNMQTMSSGSNWPIIDELEKQYE
ncbi:MAG: Gldg family protein, partial [Pirellulales bacterium]|nr:Gldg family protein [Pirellulales bacterium]